MRAFRFSLIATPLAVKEPRYSSAQDRISILRGDVSVVVLECQSLGSLPIPQTKDVHASQESSCHLDYRATAQSQSHGCAVLCNPSSTWVSASWKFPTTVYRPLPLQTNPLSLLMALSS